MFLQIYFVQTKSWATRKNYEKVLKSLGIKKKKSELCSDFMLNAARLWNKLTIPVHFLNYIDVICFQFVNFLRTRFWFFLKCSLIILCIFRFNTQ